MIHTQIITIKDGETIQIFLGGIVIKAMLRTVFKEATIIKRIFRIKDLKAKVSGNNQPKSKVVEVVVRRTLRKYSKKLWLNKMQCKRSIKLRSRIWRIKWVKWQSNYQKETQVSFQLTLKFLEMKLPML